MYVPCEKINTEWPIRNFKHIAGHTNRICIRDILNTLFESRWHLHPFSSSKVLAGQQDFAYAYLFSFK